MALFTELERKRVEARIEALEQHTAGEVVVAEVARCADYAGRRLLHAGLASVLVSALVHRLWPDLAPDWLLLLQVPVAVMCYALSGLSPLVRALVPVKERQRVVEARAAQLFTERAVFDTRDHSGVLIVLGELEHQVVVLGDRGIHARLTNTGFEGYVSTIVAAIRAGQAVEGVCSVLDQLEAVLRADFPPRADDVDELPNRVIQE